MTTHKNPQRDVEVTPLDMHDVTDARPDDVVTKPEHRGHAPTKSATDVEAQAVKLEQNGQPRAAAELRAKAAGEPPPDAQQVWLRAIAQRK